MLFNSCLSAIRTLQKFGHLPSEVEFFKSYAQHGVFRDIRLAAIDAIVDFIKSKFVLVTHNFKAYLSLMSGTWGQSFLSLLWRETNMNWVDLVIISYCNLLINNDTWLKFFEKILWSTIETSIYVKYSSV